MDSAALSPRPKSRTGDLVTTETQDGVMVYDLVTHELHQLNVTSAAVWRCCDGSRSLDELVAASGLARDTVQLALAQLTGAQLLEEPFPLAYPDNKPTRRKLLHHAAIALPVVVSISAPGAANANSDTCLQPCAKPSECRGECPTCKQYSPTNAARICCNSKQGTADFCFSK